MSRRVGSPQRIAAACGTATAGAAIQAARRGDRRALAGLSETGRYLGIGIANLITLISPDRVVIGAGIAAAGELLLSPIRTELGRRVLPPRSTGSSSSRPSWGPGQVPSVPPSTARKGHWRHPSRERLRTSGK